ncbi:MAG: type IV secretory system conjugative DNA transfer family protein, partial [Gammaproteobacteria bacterium]|nr:type IV secretory system conjugative DNA transfer family protein [Gammaproteobacteria bacterium]
MQDYEKLGAFYLGKSYDVDAGKQNDDLILYDSKDLTTHAVIIGMTGSGKTGLGIGILEEAAIDKVPIIAVDPKGDLGNILLTFPQLQPSDFQPWVNAQEAANNGKTVEAYAQDQAQLWRKGLENWGQSGERIQRLRDSVDLAMYTPGSSAGIPISVLRSFVAPPAVVRDDRDLYRERIQATATSILALLDVEADPITSREHI